MPPAGWRNIRVLVSESVMLGGRPTCLFVGDAIVVLCGSTLSVGLPCCSWFMCVGFGHQQAKRGLAAVRSEGLLL